MKLLLCYLLGVRGETSMCHREEGSSERACSKTSCPTQETVETRGTQFSL